MDRNEASGPRVSAALVIAGLWLRVGFAGAFAALAAPMLVLRGALQAGDALALFAIAAGLAWLGWWRASALLDEAPREAAPRASSTRRRAATA